MADSPRIVILVGVAGCVITAEGLRYMQHQSGGNVMVSATGTIYVDGVAVDDPVDLARAWTNEALDALQDIATLPEDGSREYQTLSARVAAYGLAVHALVAADNNPRGALQLLRARHGAVFGQAVHDADGQDGAWRAHFLHLTLTRLETRLQRSSHHVWIY